MSPLTMPPDTLYFDTPDDYLPWDRQPGETVKQFHAFCHYRDLSHQRSMDKAWRQHKLVCEHEQMPNTQRAQRLWHDWGAKWGWKERAALYDRDLDRQARQKILKEQQDARGRHARLANGAMSALTVPVRAILEAVQDPAVLAGLIEQARTNPKALMKLVDVVTFSARAFPGLVTVERLSLGLSETTVAIEDHREPELGYDIPSDPHATELALQLLDRLARPREGLALGAGVSGAAGPDRGTVDPSPSPDAADEEAG